MSTTQTISIEHHVAGQPRPYADSIFEATLTFSWKPEEKVVRQVAAATVRYGEAVADNEASQTNWFQSYFAFVRSEGGGKWRVRIVQPSTE